MGRVKGKSAMATRGNAAGGSVSAPPVGSSRGGEASPTMKGGRLKRSAKKARYPVIFTDSDSEGEIDRATYRDLRKEWKRLRRENKELRETAEAHTCEMEKSPLVRGLRSEVEHVKGLLKWSNVVIDGLHKEEAETRRRVADSETQLAALRAGWKKRLDELITKDLKIGALEEKVDRLLTEVIPHVYQMTALNQDAGKRLVELAASPGVKIQDLTPDEVDGSNSG